jgi:preprotein translocase subunit SecF
MFTRFIRRPVLAIVTSLLLVFMGLLAMRALPLSQFPEISPPRVMVMIAYPGSSADVLVQSTLIPLEKAINGVQGMKYIVSDATSAGEATIQIIFELGTDPNRAVVNVKNAVDQVLNQLPPLVQREGVIVSVVQPSMLMYVNLYSTDPAVDEKFIYNYANVNMLPELKRIPGLGRAQILGSRQYAMRVWLKPDRMRAYNLSTDEVMRAINEQSVIGRPGRTGQSSGKHAQALEYVLIWPGRYNKPEQYADIILRANPNGEILRLKDVADVELGSEFFDIYSNLNGHPSAAIVLKQNYGSNANEVIANVKAKLEELKKSFPPKMQYEIDYDVSSFLDASIEKVVHTLFEAFVLVSLVVFLFLGDWRSTLIPTLAVPVSLIGTFIVLSAFGMTINLITLFALVLAIGVVVDDAIVVVEAVHAKMAEEPISPYKAVTKVLGEIAGAVIAITLMMTAVFVPVAFMTGPVGIFYRQFAITMASSIIISGVVALTLTPVLCAMILKPHQHGHAGRRGPVRAFLDAFNRVFDRVAGRYVGLLRRIVGRRVVTFAILLGFGFGIFAVSGRRLSAQGGFPGGRGDREGGALHEPGRGGRSQWGAGAPPQFRVRVLCLLGARHLVEAAQRRARGRRALPRHERREEVRRHRAGPRDRHLVLRADGARRPARGIETEHRDSKERPRGGEAAEGRRPGDRAGGQAVRGRGAQEPEPAIFDSAANRGDGESDQLPGGSIPAARRQKFAGLRRARAGRRPRGPPGAAPREPPRREAGGARAPGDPVRRQGGQGGLLPVARHQRRARLSVIRLLEDRRHPGVAVLRPRGRSGRAAPQSEGAHRDLFFGERETDAGGLSLRAGDPQRLCRGRQSIGDDSEPGKGISAPRAGGREAESVDRDLVGALQRGAGGLHGGPAHPTGRARGANGAD